MIDRNWPSALTLAFCLAVPLAAHAQSVGTVAASSTQATASTDDQAQGDALQDIVVTATRREERLQSVPVSISAVSGDQLEKTGIANTRDLTQTIPSLNFSRLNSGFQPTIRGVGTRGTGVGDESNVAVYLDGVYLADATSLSMDLLNVARVEVLRGPQGTLFGRNSTGGLVNVITSAPSYDTSVRAQFRYGRFNERSAQAYITTGLSKTLAFSLAGQVRQDDGYIKNLVTGRDVGGRNVYAVRGKLLFEPSANASFTLTGSWTDVADGSSVNGNPYLGNTQARSLANDPRTLVTTDPYTTAPTQPQFIRTKSLLTSLEGKLDFGAVTLESTSAYQHTTNAISVETDGTPFNIGYTHADLNPYRTRNYSQELRLLSNSSGAFSWILGGFYFNARAAYDPLISTTRGVDVFIRSVQRTESVAGFGEATLKFADNWKLTGGLRYTSERRKFDGSITRLGATLSSANGLKAHFGQLTYRAILQRTFDWGNIFASYSRGFKSGVFNDYSPSATARATRPEILDAYEVGIKSDPLSWLRINLSAFHYDYKDIQLSSRDPTTSLVVLFNAASARLNGGEAEVTARVASGLNLRAYATVLDAKYTNFPNAQTFVTIYQDQSSIGLGTHVPIGNQQVIADVSGSHMIRAPKYTLGGSFDYTLATRSGEFGATANIFHSALYYWDVNNRLFQPAYVQINGELSWTLPNKKVRFGIWGQNLTNAVVQQQISPSAALDGVSYERPRTYGVSMAIKL